MEIDQRPIQIATRVDDIAFHSALSSGRPNDARELLESKQIDLRTVHESLTQPNTVLCSLATGLGAYSGKIAEEGSDDAYSTLFRAIAERRAHVFVLPEDCEFQLSDQDKERWVRQAATWFMYVNRFPIGSDVQAERMALLAQCGLTPAIAATLRQSAILGPRVEWLTEAETAFTDYLRLTASESVSENVVSAGRSRQKPRL